MIRPNQSGKLNKIPNSLKNKIKFNLKILSLQRGKKFDN